MSRTIVIGGGTGFVGSALTRKLTQKGYEILHVSRAAKPGHLTWDAVTQAGLPSTTVGVVNLAGSLILDPLKLWTSKYREQCYSSRVSTTQCLALAARQLPKPVPFVATSAIGYYPVDSKEVFNENSQSDNSFFANMCADIERAALQAEPSRVCVIRPGVVYGQGGGAFAQLKLPFSLGLGGVLGTGSQFVPFIHVDDLASLYVHVLENSTCRGAYNGVAPHFATNRDFTKALGAAMDRPTIFPVPKFALNLAFGKERAAMLLQSQKVYPQRTLDSGFKFQYPTVQECAAALVTQQ